MELLFNEGSPAQVEVGRFDKWLLKEATVLRQDKNISKKDAGLANFFTL